MSGLSISSTPLSFLQKLRLKKNPYEKAPRASFNPAPVSTATNTPGPHIALSGSARVIPLRPASPREASNLLAEARQVAGRNPVTGRRPAGATGPAMSETRGPVAEISRQTVAAPSQAADPKIAYIERAKQNGQRPYESYEAFVQDMIAKRSGNAVESEYYAPERTVEEFYAGGVRD
jgi:hypothetical protein